MTMMGIREVMLSTKSTEIARLDQVTITVLEFLPPQPFLYLIDWFGSDFILCEQDMLYYDVLVILLRGMTIDLAHLQYFALYKCVARDTWHALVWRE